MSVFVFGSFSFSRDGINWEVEFEHSGSSASKTIPVLSMVRRSGDPTMNPLNPVIGSTLDLEVYDKNKEVLSRIRQDDNEIRVTAKKNGSVWHRGYLSETTRPARMGRGDPVLSLSITDGLERLSGLQYSKSGDAELLDLLFALVDESGTDLPLRLALAIRESEMDSGVDGPGEGFKIRQEEFISNGSQLDALKALLKFWNLQLFQQQGKWRALHRSYRESGVDYEWEEDDGLSRSTGTRSPEVTVSDSDLYTGERPPRRNQVLPTAHRQTIRRSDGDASLTQTVQAGTSQAAEDTWSEVAVKTNTNTDAFTYVLDGTAEVNDTFDNADVNPGVAQVIAHNESEEKYWNSGNDSWQNGEHDIEVLINNPPSAGTVSFNKQERITKLPSQDTWAITIRVVAPLTDPNGDGQDELDSVTADTFSLRDFQRNVEPREEPPTEKTFFTTNIARREIDEQLYLSSVEPTPLFPQNGILFKDGRDNEKKRIHRNSYAFHDTRNLGAAGKDISNLRLRDRYSQTSQRMNRIEASLKRGTITLRDTVVYDGDDYVPVYIQERAASNLIEVAMVELRNDTPGLGAVDSQTD